MKIKRFNESQDNEEIVYVVSYINEHSFSGDKKFIKAFKTQMLAADYLIKFINDNYDTNYEPFYSSDNDRYFLSVDENEDFEKCLDFCDQNQIDIEICDTKLCSMPYNDPLKRY